MPQPRVNAKRLLVAAIAGAALTSAPLVWSHGARICVLTAMAHGGGGGGGGAGGGGNGNGGGHGGGVGAGYGGGIGAGHGGAVAAGHGAGIGSAAAGHGAPGHAALAAALGALNAAHASPTAMAHAAPQSEVGMTAAYDHAVLGALAMPTNTLPEIVSRNAAIFQARQGLAPAANHGLSPAAVAQVDSLLGLPYSDPSIGVGQ